MRHWIRQAERDTGQRARLTTAEQQRLTGLERDNRELRRVTEMQRKSSAYFAQAEPGSAPAQFSPRHPPWLTGLLPA